MKKINSIPASTRTHSKPPSSPPRQLLQHTPWLPVYLSIYPHASSSSIHISSSPHNVLSAFSTAGCLLLQHRHAAGMQLLIEDTHF